MPSAAPASTPRSGHGPAGALSVRAYLAAMVGVLAVALIAVGAYQTSSAFATARGDAGLDTAFQARLAAETLALSMDEASAFTAGTAANPSVLQLFTAAGEDEAQCSLTAGGTGPFPEGSIHFLDPTGSLFCSSVAEGIDRQGIDYGGLDWFASVTSGEAGSPVVAEPFVDPATQKLSVAFAAPVIDPAGGSTGVVVYALPVDGVAASLRSTYGGRAHLSFHVAWTATGQLVSSSEVSTSTTMDSALPLLAAPPNDAIPGLDGVSRFYRAWAGANTGFSVTAGVPEAATLSEARRQLWGQLRLTVLALGITLGFGLLVNRRIGRPLRQLTKDVDEAGRAVAPEPVAADGPQEVRQLVEAFNGMLAARASVEEQLRQRAMVDELTGLPNRVVALDRLSHALERRGQGLVAVLSIDLDRFSLVNESLGRDVGDRMLIMVAGQIKSVLRPEDTIARFYGDEFVIVCEGMASRDDAGRVGDRIAESLRQPLHSGEFEATISVSIGIAVGRCGTDNAARLLSDADTARSKAKERGKARYEYFEDTMREGAVNRLGLENDLRRAVEREELRLVYQPIIDLRTERIIGAEALVRWHHPTKGLLLPGVFIDLAEETGLIVPIGLQVLRQACLQAAEWSGQGRPIRVSVNLSPRQISEPRLAEDLRAAINGANLDPSLLCIELTESTLMREDAAADVLKRIRALGVALSVDDFGTGYSSLAYLQRFPLDELKIDRSFIRGLGTEPSATALVAAIMGVARALGLSVVAEGIEEPAQLEVLRGMDCDAAQGFLFMRPQPPDVLASMLELDAVALSDSSAVGDAARN